jgi:hypothetical protein
MTSSRGLSAWQTPFASTTYPFVLVNATGGAPGRIEADSGHRSEFTPPPDWAGLIAELDAKPGDLLVTRTGSCRKGCGHHLVTRRM